MMTKIFLLATSLLSLSSFAQNKSTDSTGINISYHQSVPHNIAIIINGQLMPHFEMTTLDVYVIGTFNVKKTDTVINGHTYNASILINTKDGYTPGYITLNDLKRKHTSIETGPSIFMINGHVISKNYEKITVDEKYIQKIEVSKISNPEEKIDVNLIKLSTRTKANTKKSEEFMIRGGNAVEPAANYFDNGFGVKRQKATLGKETTL